MADNGLDRNPDSWERRTVLQGGALAAAALFAPGLAFAQSGDLARIRAAVENAHDTSVRRIQDWIRLPSIAAENRNMPEGAKYMADLARSITMPHEQTTITTRDGECPAHVFTPGAGRTGPAVILYMDAGGIRPAALGMAERLSKAGYVVLLPDPFYRYGPYGPFDAEEVFKGDVRAILGPLIATTSNAKAAEDTEAFLAYLDTRSDVQGDKAGAVGFCMGGGMAIAAAGAWPDRFAAVASFHGGNLATDAPDSPHSYAPKLKAELYIAAAENDGSYPPEMAERFEQALDEAHVRYRAETYPAAHGWMVPDFPVYDEAAAERGWREMCAFFERTLQQQPVR